MRNVSPRWKWEVYRTSNSGQNFKNCSSLAKFIEVQTLHMHYQPFFIFSLPPLRTSKWNSATDSWSCRGFTYCGSSTSHISLGHPLRKSTADLNLTNYSLGFLWTNRLSPDITTAHMPSVTFLNHFQCLQHNDYLFVSPRVDSR